MSDYDLEPPVDEPISVNHSSIPEGALTILRYVLTTLGTVLLTKGFLPAGSDVNAIVGALLVLGNTVWGTLATKRNHAIKVTMANELPNSIAQVK